LKLFTHAPLLIAHIYFLLVVLAKFTDSLQPT